MSKYRQDIGYSKIRNYAERTPLPNTDEMDRQPWPGHQSVSSYSRNHEMSGPQKQSPIAGSSDPLFRGDPTRYNPEELLVAALSACHMLWVLHLCGDAGIVITEYSDEALGFMAENDGSAQVTGVTLRPVMSITDLARAAEASAIHDRAYAVCALLIAEFSSASPTGCRRRKLPQTKAS
jgi:organic hydroperoxide reductase OsmC/OhrA